MVVPEARVSNKLCTESFLMYSFFSYMSYLDHKWTTWQYILQDHIKTATFNFAKRGRNAKMKTKRWIFQLTHIRTRAWPQPASGPVCKSPPKRSLCWSLHYRASSTWILLCEVTKRADPNRNKDYQMRLLQHGVTALSVCLSVCVCACVIPAPHPSPPNSTTFLCSEQRIT